MPEKALLVGLHRIAIVSIKGYGRTDLKDTYPDSKHRSEGLVGKKIFCQSLGCKVNSYETDALRSLFEAKGFVTTSEPGECDVYIINTCTVTAEADRKSGQMLRRAAKLAPKAIIAAMGCRIRMRGQSDCADICVGTTDRASLVDLVIERIAESEGTFRRSAVEGSASSSDRHSATDSAPEHMEYEEFGPVISREGTRAFVKIQDGCDNFCSYCIIPYARGRARSRTAPEILREIRKLGDFGYSEIVLTGINLGAYGKDFEIDEEPLNRLLSEIDRIESIRRIRLGSIEPNMITDRFVQALAGTGKFCRHLHVSLQSGSDTVLKRMNRKYETTDFLSAVERVRARIPDISLTTDIIVGFPAETEEEHRESLLFCEKIGFSKIHVFPYSLRSGTVAATMKPQIDPLDKSRRKAEFLALSQSLFERSAARMIGKTVSVLVETRHKNGVFGGYSRDYFRVRFTSLQAARPGQEIFIRITGVEKEALIGEDIYCIQMVQDSDRV
jgi:threonylcarbamoyladenosine tRNA methylthiotransferase MtaB